MAERVGLRRPFLRAWRPGFDHPVSGERVEVSEDLPPELQGALQRARELS